MAETGPGFVPERYEREPKDGNTMLQEALVDFGFTPSPDRPNEAVIPKTMVDLSKMLDRLEGIDWQGIIGSQQSYDPSTIRTLIGNALVSAQMRIEGNGMPSADQMKAACRFISARGGFRTVVIQVIEQELRHPSEPPRTPFKSAEEKEKDLKLGFYHDQSRYREPLFDDVRSSRDIPEVMKRLANQKRSSLPTIEDGRYTEERLLNEINWVSKYFEEQLADYRSKNPDYYRNHPYVMEFPEDYGIREAVVRILLNQADDHTGYFKFSNQTEGRYGR